MLAGVGVGHSMVVHDEKWILLRTKYSGNFFSWWDGDVTLAISASSVLGLHGRPNEHA